MALPYFPVDFSAMSARRKFREVDGGESFKVGENQGDDAVVESSARMPGIPH